MNDIVARVRLLVERFRALGGIPELCDLAWELCNENERLRARVDPSPLAQLSENTDDQARVDKGVNRHGQDLPQPPTE